jgi:hypothetical protein
MRVAEAASFGLMQQSRRRHGMYPIAMYPPVRQLDDPTVRVKAGRRARGEDRAALRWRPFGSA